ncbi:unnamed protein product [Lupinus luteus]|uniref:Glycosyltransferase n=1 Tax=Lupinus luteus TaxID=3873 RepID=A0AAV1X3Z1_LUPLU
MGSFENNDKEEVHVLLVAFSAQGHINPLLRLGKSLRSKGLHVSLATTDTLYHRVFKYTANGDDSSTVPTSITTNGIEVFFFNDGFQTDVERAASVDKYMEADVAAEFNIPCACFWIQPSALFAIYYSFYNNLNTFPTLTDPNISVKLPGLPLLETQDLPSFVLPTNPFGTFPKILSSVFKGIDKIKWVLVNSYYELEKDVIDSTSQVFPIITVGPVVPVSLLGGDESSDVGIEMWKPEDSCIEWLNHKPDSSVIYISFGSLTVLSSEQKDSIAEALKKIHHPFLWVIKEENKDPLPKEFLEETKDRGMVIPWCPQTKVLDHPAVACFLTHCGWNSMLEAITAGKPMIGYPKWTDQPTNAKLITDVFHTGVRLKQDSNGFVPSEEIEKAIEQVLEGATSEEFKKNAEELKRAGREAVAEGGSSDRNIQSFVDEILGKTTDH